MQYNVNPIALRKAKTVYNFGLSECNGVKVNGFFFRGINSEIYILSPFSMGINS